MATQASAITFLSTPGPGLRGRHALRAVLLRAAARDGRASARSFVPIYYRLKVFTAYEYLETRFDLKTRLLGAFLFLIQRGLAAGHHDLRAGIILSTILGWPLEPDQRGHGRRWSSSTRSRAARGGQPDAEAADGGDAGRHGGGGRRHRAGGCPQHVSLGDAVDVAGALGRMNVVELRLRPRRPLQLLVGHHRRLLPGALVLRHRPVAGAALPVGALGHREPPGAAVQRPAQDPDAVR